MDSKIKFFVGDNVLCKLHIKRWQKELQLDSVTRINSKDELEELLNPAIFDSGGIYVWNKPSKDDLNAIDIVDGRIDESKYLAIVVSSVDKRLTVFKKFPVVDADYMLYSEHKSCIDFIKKASKFDADVCEDIYTRVAPMEVELPNKNGNKVPTHVLNISLILREIEKLQLLDSFNKSELTHLIPKGYCSSHWGFVDAVLNKDMDTAIAQIGHLVHDMNEFLMLIGLLAAEAKLGIFVASCKARNVQGILAQISSSRERSFFIDADNSSEKKSKLDVHPFRVFKCIQRCSKGGFGEYCAHMLQKCYEFNKMCRNDIPISFLTEAFVMDLFSDQ